MTLYDDEKRELSGCIVGKARYALQISDYAPRNTKPCSDRYWNRVITRLLQDHTVDKTIERHARENKDRYVPVLLHAR